MWMPARRVGSSETEEKNPQAKIPDQHRVQTPTFDIVC